MWRSRMAKAMGPARRRIDAIDQELVRLLHERARCALAIGAEKRRFGLPVLDPEREAAVLARVEAEAEGPFPLPALRRIFLEILAACRSLQEQDKGRKSGSD